MRAIGFYKAFDSVRVTYVIEREDNGTLFSKTIIDCLNDAASIRNTMRVFLSRRRVIRKRCQRVEIRTNYVLGEVVWNVANLISLPSV